MESEFIVQQLSLSSFVFKPDVYFYFDLQSVLHLLSPNEALMSSSFQFLYGTVVAASSRRHPYGPGVGLPHVQPKQFESLSSRVRTLATFIPEQVSTTGDVYHFNQTKIFLLIYL